MNQSMQDKRNGQGVFNNIIVFLNKIKHNLSQQYNKNIYTRILFTNVVVFTIALFVLINFANFIVTHSVYDQVQQDLLRKSKRVNYALTNKNISAEPKSGNQFANEKELLRFLADSFNIKIIIFDKDGTILSTSEEQELVPLSKIDAKYTEMLISGETKVARITDKETGQLTFTASIPMGNVEDTEHTVEKGIFLESKPANLDASLNKMRLLMLLGGIIVLIFIIFISLYLANRISRPISRLVTSLAEFNGGNYVISDENKSFDEINDLADQIKKLTVNLEEIQSKSNKYEEERTRLFAEISHELRTPLTAVQGFTEAIRDDVVEDEMLQKKYLDMIYDQTIHINRLVDDILSLSRIESGDVTVGKLPLDLVALAHGVIMSMEDLANNNNTTITFNKNSDDAIMIGDVDRMEQIIRNLLKNAINATENGNIKVTIDSNESDILFSIEDTGVGISPEELPHIWDRFYRAKHQRNTDLEVKGTGLGLVIVNKLVKLQDGKIDVESQLGKGTIFRLSFPRVI
ncbi:sensor histidine kinase [Dehalobacterium formicoaceticum]|uniref:histidine kinase n=1 Tax=Dehalobacterium formicoaceticum TaxID=51515 RepID=A0ABT1Y102_9FIRM|nr:HAMP domain-containing sensor histidine kinase [Dehalobacterium formicoaceticum]MCR6544528.1 HAMP domain-containing histidine kinase [Dehalobacterium formicoaceticum]